MWVGVRGAGIAPGADLQEVLALPQGPHRLPPLAEPPHSHTPPPPPPPPPLGRLAQTKRVELSILYVRVVPLPTLAWWIPTEIGKSGRHDLELVVDGEDVFGDGHDELVLDLDVVRVGQVGIKRRPAAERHAQREVETLRALREVLACTRVVAWW